MRAGLIVVAALAVAVVAAALYRSSRTPESVRIFVPVSSVQQPPAPAPEALPSRPVPAVKPPLAEELRKDPLLDQWYRSIQRRDAPGVGAAQSALLQREDETRGVLERIAKDEPDARVRAFSVTVLSRFKMPPADDFFIRRLEDADFGPRLAALAALEKLEMRGSLPGVERLASGDPNEQVRAAAAKTAATLRAK